MNTPTDAETRLAFERRFAARDLTPASEGFDGYKDETTDAMARAWAEAVRWCVNRQEKTE